MRAHFAEVLARENARLADVTDGEKFGRWRRRVVEEVMTPTSPYALALRQTGDVTGRADFLHRWRGLIEKAIDRLQRPGASAHATCSAARPTSNDVDPHRTAVLILAAINGGSTLSQIAQDPCPLHAALDIALAPFTKPAGINDDHAEPEPGDE